MAEVLNIKGISKNYGAVRALTDLSLQINEGEIYGILGPNGSGKTTTLGIILDVLNANAGSFTWFGEAPDKKSRKRIGSILETPNFYSYLTAHQNLSINCKIKQVNPAEIDRVLEVVGLTKRANSKFKTFSLGMKQRLALASALLGDPEVLVLDEPTNGLDPQGIAEVREIIKNVAKEGKTIIMASHILDEVEKICSHVAVLKQGQLLTSGPMEAVLNSKEQLYVVAEDHAKLKMCLGTIEGVSDIKESGDRFYLMLEQGKGGGYLNKALFEKGVVVSELGVQKSDLEANFLELVK